jgi:isoleucyl-tRNA synthetase
MKSFPDLPASVTELEEQILQQWEGENTFQQSLEQTAGGEPFVFYEGPPTANGRPGIHHVFSRTIKDTVARFRTMQGRYVPRMAGWDTHGLPVEIEAEKSLGISGKPQIEEVGIERFNDVCRESVLRYTAEWERFSARIGYWLDYSDPYVTFHASYIESVWWSLKQIADRGLIYRGHKILPYCPRCGTALSSHELAQGYREVRDPSLYLTMPVLEEGEERAFLVWTTTPWTLVSNVALAVDPMLTYAEVVHEGRRLVLARDRVEPLLGDEAEILREFRGSELLGVRYRRPFEWLEVPDAAAGAADRAWRVVAGDFVSAEEGTGIVHMSPAFGADDYAVAQKEGLPMLQPLDERGTFRSDLPVVGGKFVKDADDDLVADLKSRGSVFRATRELHTYPHCWRCRSPLLYMARDSWFIRTTAVRDELLENNRQIRWHPPEMGSGRFGEWLENNVDWAISRNRFWGTPLPIWVCDEDPSHVEVIGSLAELRERAGGLPDDFDPHRPFVDEITWPRGDGKPGTMRRTPEVIDVWYDSGSMPFAQFHHPFGEEGVFERFFPADFICEGVDQTRGWFYSLLAISTLLGRGPAYRNVIVNDLVLDAEAQKMSKTRGNAVDPWEAVAEFGADALRWYLVATSHPWLPKRFDPDGVREVQRKVFDTLRNTYKFFALYANLEGWEPGAEAPPPSARPLIDRWLLSRLAEVTRRITASLDAYDLTPAVRMLGDFVVDDLSNWYVRRSRDRFWGSADREDTAAAFATLHEALVTVARLAAPVIPFFADWLHRALEGGRSVHLARFPEPATGPDPALERGMDAVRSLSTLGRAAREEVRIRVRQPLGVLHAVVPADIVLSPEMLEILRDELNVHRVDFMDRAEELVTFEARPNFRVLGARFGKRTPRVAEMIRGLSSADLARFGAGDPLEIEIDGERVLLMAEELELVQTARGEAVVEAEGGFTMALDTVITPDLRREGLARELINRIQRLRKDSGLEVADRIRLAVAGASEIREAAGAFTEFIRSETLAVSVDIPDSNIDPDSFPFRREVDLDGVAGIIGIARVSTGSGA